MAIVAQECTALCNPGNFNVVIYHPFCDIVTDFALLVMQMQMLMM